MSEVVASDAAVLRDLRRVRRERRLGDTEWFDVLYRVYLFALVGTGAVLYLSDTIAGLLDESVSTEDILTRGPSIAGIVAALAFGIGLQNGSDGGPVSADATRNATDVESEQLELIDMVTDDVSVPVAVKVSPYYSAFANFALGLQEVGASGIVMFNRFYAPDLDLETLDVQPHIHLSNSHELTLPLRWIGVTRELLTISIGASTGVHGGTDAVKLILAGANVTMATSSLLIHGPGHMAAMEEELATWMRDHDYRSITEMRGAARRETSADPSAYERANYIGNLTKYATRFRSSYGVPLRRS